MEQSSSNYEPPTIIVIGSLSDLTQTKGAHVGNDIAAASKV
jgi:hypothetical protein